LKSKLKHTPTIKDVLKEVKPVKIKVEEFYEFRKELVRNEDS